MDYAMAGLSDRTGVEIRGVDLARPVDEADRGGDWARIETKGCITVLRPSRRALWALLRMRIRL
jgi:hypothetical protein